MSKGMNYTLVVTTTFQRCFKTPPISRSTYKTQRICTVKNYFSTCEYEFLDLSHAYNFGRTNKISIGICLKFEKYARNYSTRDLYFRVCAQYYISWETSFTYNQGYKQKVCQGEKGS